jgi:prepilin-type N-terminal cleavage/methylation domain-containing protein
MSKTTAAIPVEARPPEAGRRSHVGALLAVLLTLLLVLIWLLPRDPLISARIGALLRPPGSVRAAPNRGAMMRRRAFTILELLIVIAIIVVLAGIIFAGLYPARERARERVCASQLHQIGVALSLYVSDYGGVDPVPGVRMYHYQLGLPGYGKSVTVFFDQYVKDRRVLYCPSYHDGAPLSQLGSTYMWSAFAYEGSSPPEPDYPGLVARLAGEYPLTSCLQHNADLDPTYLPRWATFRVLALKLNQQVETVDVPARDANDLWTYWSTNPK